jgi:2'-5' RNA ligase
VKIMGFVDRLAGEFPGQHFYQAAELHATVLTFISATELWRKEMNDLPAFREILAEVMRCQRPFKLEFRGVTAATNAVLIQGFPMDDGLENLREEIRRRFAQRGFAGHLDRRYPNRAAHITAMRFCRPKADWRRLAALVQENRETFFGETRVETLQLVLSDWYASTDTAQILEEYRLPAASVTDA